MKSRMRFAAVQIAAQQVGLLRGSLWQHWPSSVASPRCGQLFSSRRRRRRPVLSCPPAGTDSRIRRPRQSHDLFEPGSSAAVQPRPFSDDLFRKEHSPPPSSPGRFFFSCGSRHQQLCVLKWAAHATRRRCNCRPLAQSCIHDMGCRRERTEAPAAVIDLYCSQTLLSASRRCKKLRLCRNMCLPKCTCSCTRSKQDLLIDLTT
mmetsp:Transcript_26669/g.67182  ORF Transcript_26669/g.67182 Transcript_26669/m.67182 type:complete len:204 (-) Transcript_26669:8-619(-)